MLRRFEIENETSGGKFRESRMRKKYLKEITVLKVKIANETS